MSYEELRAAAQAVRERTGRPEHRVAVVLGPAWAATAPTCPGRWPCPTPSCRLPGAPRGGARGHPVLGGARGPPRAGLSGRVHTYEGWPLEKVVFAARTAVLCGCRTIVLTNAAGGSPRASPPATWC